MDVREAIEAAKHGSHSRDVKCPAHDDGNASLSIGPGETQPVVLKCHTGCTNDDVLAAIGMTWDEVCAPSLRIVDNGTSRIGHQWWNSSLGKSVKEYSYLDEEGRELFWNFRFEPTGQKKSFRLGHLTHGELVRNADGIARVLYRLPQVLAEVHKGDHAHVWLFEGEKDVDRAVADGLCGTTSPMGGTNWKPEYALPLRGAHVSIVADKDETGRMYARGVASDLTELGCTVRILEGLVGNDYSDHRDAGHTAQDLVTVWRSATRSYGYAIDEYSKTVWRDKPVIIPCALAAEDVVLFVGPEGHGKSMFQRQFMLCAAAGIHPFTLEAITPVRAMIIDPENDQSHVSRDVAKIIEIIEKRGFHIEKENLRILNEYRKHPDLMSSAGRSWFLDVIKVHEPQVVAIGPVNMIVSSEMNKAPEVRQLRDLLHQAASICGTAFLLEHHAPLRAQGDKNREMRPHGSSEFSKFPEAGYGMTPTDQLGVYNLNRFRWPRVSSLGWPEQIRRGEMHRGEMPWMAVDPFSVSGSSNVVNLH